MEVKGLFKEFNENKASRKHETVLVLGPPRSGKTFFINNHLKPHAKAEEYTIGLIGKRTQPSNKIIDAFKRIMPWVSKLNYISIEENDELRKFGNEFVKSLKEMLGDEAPKHIINEIINRAKKINTNSIITYYIPWDYKENIDNETKEALDLITNTFNKYNARIKWIKAEYIPPGLVKEVAELIKTKGKNEAEKTVDEWVDAYTTVLKIAGLDKGEWEESFVISARTFFNTLGALGALMYITSDIILNTLATTIITLLTFHIFKTPQSARAGDVIELTAKLAKLKASKPSNEPCGEFNELGKLIAYKLATALGLNVEEVCNALTEISGIDKDKLRSMVEDIGKRITEVEEKVKILEKRMEKFEKEVRAGINVVNRDEFEKGELYPNIEVADGELKIGVDEEYYHVVEAGKFGSTINNVINKLEESKVVVLTGHRGIGKSVLAASVIWRLLNNVKVGLVAKVDELNENNDSEFENFIDNYSIEFKTVFGRLLILYDPSSTKIYEREREKQPIPANINKTIKLLTDSKLTEDSMLLIVLPSDIYDNTPSEDTKKSLEQHRIEVELSDIEFLSEIIRDYSGKCEDKLNENELSELASEVAKYEEGYTLIARLVGMELTKSDCNVDDIKRMIEESEHKASAFIAGFINKWFDVIDDKGQVNSKRINALAEILAIRRYFTWFSPGDPILTKGIVKLIDNVNGSEKEMSDEMANWLTRRSHDLVENTIERLLDGEDLGEASKPWMMFKTEEASEIPEVVEYFINEYGEKFLKKLKKLFNFSGCWKRAALIIGHALSGHLKLPDKEFSNSAIVDALNPCKIDDYLLVDNEIPIFVAIIISRMSMPDEESKNFVSIFADEYENAIDEAKKLLEIWRKRENDKINTSEAIYAEVRYALGLAYIVAEATRLGKAINEDDADATLKVVIPALRLGAAGTAFKKAYSILSTAIYLKPADPYVDLLRALSTLRDKAPQQYLTILAEATEIDMDKNTATFILVELGYILFNFFHNLNFFNKLTKLVWPLVDAARVYSNVLKQALYGTPEEDIIVNRMCDLLNALKEESDELATIAEAYALIPELAHSEVRNLMRYALETYYYRSYNLVTRVTKVRKSLKELANKSDELLKNEHFMNWIKQFYVTGNISQQKIRKMITDTEVKLTFSLAMYKLKNGKLDDASKLFDEITEVSRSVEDWYNYIIARDWLLRAEFIKAKSIDEYVNVASNFEKLWNETSENLEYNTDYLWVTSTFLGEYLVYLASIGRYDDIEKTLNKHGDLLNYNKRASVLTRLMLRLLGFTKVAEVEPEEPIDAYEEHIYPQLLPALQLALGIKPPSVEKCESLNLEDFDLCINAFLAVKGDSDALTKLRDSVDVKSRELAQGLDGKMLIQLLAPITSHCQFALMLYALVSGNAELAKEHARWVSEVLRGLLGKLFGDVYGACCDVSSEGFKLALLKLYHIHI